MADKQQAQAQETKTVRVKLGKRAPVGRLVIGGHVITQEHAAEIPAEAYGRLRAEYGLVVDKGK